MKIIKDSLKRNRAAVCLWLIFCLTGLAVFILYDVFLEPLIYAAIISLFFLAVFLCTDMVREKKYSSERAAAADAADGWRSLPQARSLAEREYQQMVTALGQRTERLEEDLSEERQESLDYYTAWVHQIKTPIAVMKLKLSEDTEEHRGLRAELFRIEQYAEMALQYIRLGSSANDLVIREYDLDELIRESVRKYAAQFVVKGLRLEYSPVRRLVITDRKWFACILEQLISNAVKYTSGGSVTISLMADRLSVTDTGPGIAAEDLPRIFEKGYTGINGRIGENSSGLGLYLAGRAADLLAIPLSVESTVGEGSRFTLDLREKTRRIDR